MARSLLPPRKHNTRWTSERHSILERFSMRGLIFFLFSTLLLVDHGFALQQHDVDTARELFKNHQFILENKGQIHPHSVKFYTNTQDMLIGFARGKVYFYQKRTHQVGDELLALKLPAEADPRGIDLLDSTSNVLRPNAKYTGIRHYAKISYQLAPGVEALFRIQDQTLKYDVIVSPHTPHDYLVFTYEGASSIDLSDTGALSIFGDAGKLIDSAPVCYQEKNGKQVNIDCGYKLLDKHSFGFEVGRYDPSLPLVIDPACSVDYSALEYSSFLGGTGTSSSGGDDRIQNTHYDPETGFLYVLGETETHNFPVSANGTPHSSSSGPQRDGFIGIFFAPEDIAASPVPLVITTYGGSQGRDHYYGMSLDAQKNIYLCGRVGSNDPGLFFTENNTSTNFNGLQLKGPVDIWAVKLSPDALDVKFSVAIGGSGGDNARGGCEYSHFNNRLYIAGKTTSNSIPNTQGRFQENHAGDRDSILVALTQRGRAMFATFIGGSSFDQLANLVVDSRGSVIASGATHSSDFPREGRHVNQTHFVGGPNAQNPGYGTGDGVVVKFSPNLRNLLWSTFLAGSLGDASCGNDCLAVGHMYNSQGVAVERDAVWVIGNTSSTDFLQGVTTPAPASPACNNTPNGPKAGFIAKLSSDGFVQSARTIDCINEMSGIALPHVAGSTSTKVVFGGWTSGNQLPVTDNAMQSCRSNSTSDGILGAIEGDLSSPPFYLSHIGGDTTNTSGQDTRIRGMAAHEKIYFGGDTRSPLFPVSSNAHQILHSNHMLYQGQSDGFFGIVAFDSLHP